jgi:hypothetical protein
MKKIIAIGLIIVALSINAAEVGNVKRMAFVAKNLFDTKLIKDPEFIQGESFMIGNDMIAYRLFFNGIVEGRKKAIQVNCKEPSTEDSDRENDCKVVKMSDI